jgi:glycerol-3-phosphate dehydrogenase
VVTGAACIDCRTGNELSIAARTVVNATGSHLNDLLAPRGAEVYLPLLQAMNLVTSRPGPGAAIGGRSRSGRNLFLVPWRGQALFGTWESPTTREAGDTAVRDDDVRAFLSDLNEAFPSFHLTESDITMVHRGVVPAVVSKEFEPTLDGRELVFTHRPEGLAGTISVAGTKYTTARAVAERIVDRLYPELGYPFVESMSDQRTLPHVNLTGEKLLQHAASHEMVETLADAVLRRTGLGSLGLPDEATLSHAASIVAAVQGWSDMRRRDEIAALRGLY